MTKQEFIERTGIAVTDAQYSKVEDLYLNAGQMNKDEFCEDYKKHAGSKIIEVLNDQVDHYESAAANLYKQREAMVDFLIEQSHKWSATDLRDKVIEMVGPKAYIERKIKMGCRLWQLDKDLILELLNE